MEDNNIYGTFINNLMSGKYDDRREDILRAIRNRDSIVRQQDKYQTLATLRPGDKVRLKGLSPKYLIGLTGVVGLSGRGQRVEVILYNPSRAGRFAIGGKVQAPANCVEAI